MHTPANRFYISHVRVALIARALPFSTRVMAGGGASRVNVRMQTHTFSRLLTSYFHTVS